jgi:hypothetical protein
MGGHWEQFCATRASFQTRTLPDDGRGHRQAPVPGSCGGFRGPGLSAGTRVGLPPDQEPPPLRTAFLLLVVAKEEPTLILTWGPPSPDKDEPFHLVPSETVLLTSSHSRTGGVSRANGRGEWRAMRSWERIHFLCIRFTPLPLSFPSQPHVAFSRAHVQSCILSSQSWLTTATRPQRQS